MINPKALSPLGLSDDRLIVVILHTGIVMSHHPSDSYFATQVLSSPRHKLHLMLLEGALRHGRRAEALLGQGHDAAADEALIRGQEIMAELLAGLKPGLAPAL